MARSKLHEYTYPGHVEKRRRGLSASGAINRRFSYLRPWQSDLHARTQRTADRSFRCAIATAMVVVVVMVHAGAQARPAGLP